MSKLANALWDALLVAVSGTYGPRPVSSLFNEQVIDRLLDLLSFPFPHVREAASSASAALSALLLSNNDNIQKKEENEGYKILGKLLRIFETAGKESESKL